MEPTLIVVGGGVAGAAAALRAAQYLIPTVWIRGDRATAKASRSAYVKNIDNMIGVHPGIVKEKVVAALREAHPEAAEAVAALHLHISTQDLVDNAAARIRGEFGEYVEFVEESAVEAAAVDGGYRVRTGGGRTVEAPFLVLATGVMDRQPVVYKQRGERTLEGIHWLFPYANQETLLYCIRCEGHLVRGRRVALIGAGVATAEVALMVRERYPSEVVVLTAGEPVGWDERRARLLAAEGIEVLEGRLVDVHGADKGATLHGFTLEDGTRVEVDMAFVSMGLFRVYNDLAGALGARLEESDRPESERHVLVDTWGETSVPNLFAVGDMAAREGEPMMKQVYTSQEYAVRAVDTVDRRRRGSRREALLSG